MKVAMLVDLLLVASCDAFALGVAKSMSVDLARSQTHLFVMQAEEPFEGPTDEVSAEEVPAGEDAAEKIPVGDQILLSDEPTFDEAGIAKEALMAEVADGLSGPRPDRAVIGEILLSIEAQNPTSSPAISPLLNGKWKFVYTSAPSPGLAALQKLLKAVKKAPKSPSGADMIDVQETFLTIAPEQPRATSTVTVRVLSFENTIRLASRLEAESAVRLSETYDSAASDLGDLKLPFQSPLQFKRSLLVSYLDEELLVVRDAAGRPDVLMRCSTPTEWEESPSVEEENARDEVSSAEEDDTPSA